MKTILVVDDEERIRRVFWEILRKRGFHVIKARDAVEAHEVLKGQQKVDLVLLDIKMPEIQGDTLYEVMQSFHYKTKVIVCSVFPVEEQGRKMPNAADYYDKSDSLVILLQKINKIFEDGVPNKQVLIIDDNPEFRLLYSKLLMDMGYYPIDMGDNPEFFRFLKKQIRTIDLILLDIAVPRSGLEFYRMIRNEHPQAKVIISSAFSEDQVKIFKADDYFNKWGDLGLLINKVKHLIGDGLSRRDEVKVVAGDRR